MKITLVTVGRTKNVHAAALCADYDKRIRRMTSFSLLEVKDARGQDAGRAMKSEGDRILAQLPQACRPVLLDERGKRRTSVDFADWLSDIADETRDLRFVLGGPWGFAASVRDRCRDSLRLSDMTLPHEFARVLFLEQLYRALSIQAGGSYHHGDPNA